MEYLRTAFAAATAYTFVAGAAFAEPKTNLLHQWATGSDAQAIAKLGEMFTAKGGTWQQTSIAGHTANTLAKLRADVIAGNAPPAVQLKGPEIAEWNETGMTANLDELATAENWEKVVAPELLPVMKPTGSWVAAPMNIHRINWLWASPKVMQEAGVAEVPKTWTDFNAACDKIVASGKICISHSTADWTDSTVFEVVVYGMDLDLFKKAFVEGDVEAMRSDGMVKAFEQFRTMTTKYMDPGMNGRDWDTMSHLVGRGEAAFHIMGDWTLGLLTAGGFKEGTDYVCAQAPTDWGKPGFILNSDSVVFFQQKDPDYVEGQKLLASTILSPEFQTIFNQTKGSIPARLDVDLSNGFNPCQQLSQKDLQASIDGGTLVRSMAHNMTIPQKVRGAIMDTVTEFVATPDMTAQDAASAMADAAEAQM
ncbi:ABC transporter substrate-binding protein [Mesorhizobium sp.]|uniref:ABC transporter substrate-binding protein n=1 Tax=Mesorhizobium sp. TaxID=1871066 RepID=UPI000FE61CA8|nr:ABC transporter substrate-binding protein [Mesorhizobium sp.]RWD30123.1 MAG: carbohydrate ABC transporter substrate-binding protein [Mesorhizobium sp.]RWF03398.1 MAG: carbohydrate ABC transporter substrate-binding protein [Mesorhizobium sp.]TIS39322.1 MAG: carbohydrate ABC transporter substrate-binding protein [Mesorhizobium sp.]